MIAAHSLPLSVIPLPPGGDREFSISLYHLQFLPCTGSTFIKGQIKVFVLKLMVMISLAEPFCTHFQETFCGYFLKL